jgi:hypothetical protein
MNEEVATALWLRDYLASDADLSSSVQTFAIRSTRTTDPLPYIKVDILERRDVMVVNAGRVWVDLLFLVRGITKGPDWTDVQTIAARVDTVLHRLQGSGDATIFIQEVFREEPFSDETIEAGDLYVHSGGLYRIRAQAL